MKRTMILGILLATLVLIVACAPKEVEKAPTVPKEPTKPVAPTEPSSDTTIDTTADQDVAAVDKEVVDIDDITQDMDLNDLEQLDKDLKELENLEI